MRARELDQMPVAATPNHAPASRLPAGAGRKTIAASMV